MHSRRYQTSYYLIHTDGRSERCTVSELLNIGRIDRAVLTLAVQMLHDVSMTQHNRASPGQFRLNSGLIPRAVAYVTLLRTYEPLELHGQ